MNSTNVHPKDGNELTAAAALTSLVGAAALREDSKKEYEDKDEEDEEEEEGDTLDFEIPQRFTKSGRKRAVPFPLKLMKVLSCKEYNHIINWMPSGKSFSIKKPKLFTAQILPEHFKSAKYSSFTRKLHRWGFMRHYRGEEAGAFFHEEFQRDRLDLVEKMTCYKQEPPKAIQAVRKQVEAPSNRNQLRKTNDTAVGRRESVPAGSSTVTSPVAPQNPTIAQPVVPPCIAVQRPSLDHTSFVQGLEPSLGLRSQLDNTALTFRPNLNPPSTDLDAVIEAEVARRLKERINAAALSSRLALMQRIEQNPTTSQLLLWNQQQPQQQRNISGLNNNGLQLNQQARTALMMAAARRGFYKPPGINFAALGNTSNLSTPPPTNIQGARTA